MSVSLGLSAVALEPTREERLVTSARSLLGVPYELGGRMRTVGEGIDCQGVLFFAAERLGRCGWKSFSVFPTASVRDVELGERVAGMDPVATGALDLSKLRPGDVLLLVGEAKNPAEPAIGRLDETPVWVWHTGFYTGAGNWIVGDHYAGEVVEVPLAPYLREHADVYQGVFVTRLQGRPRPVRCRRHRRMSYWR